MDHALDNIEPSFGMDASFAESSIYDLRHTYLNDMDTFSSHKDDSASSKDQATNFMEQHHTSQRLPITDWQGEEVAQWAGEALRHRGVHSVNDLWVLRTLSGRHLLRLSHQDLCNLVGQQCGTILHQQLQVLRTSQGSQSMLLDEASGGSLYTNPDSLYTNPDSLYNPESLHSNPDSLYTSPNSLYTSPDSLYTSPESLYTSPDSLYNPESLHSNSDSLYSKPDSLYSKPNSLYTNPDSLHSKPDSLYSNPDPLYSNPESVDMCSRFKMTPEELVDLQQYIPEEPWPPMAQADPLPQDTQDPLLDHFQDLDIREQIVPVKNEEPEVCSSEAGGVGATESGGLLIPSSDMLKKIPSKTRKRVRGPKSWEFLMRLLADQRTNPAFIRWEDEANATFRLTQPAIIAQMWANRTNDKRNLSYNNFARGLRHHYTTGALYPVMEKQLVYQCGPTALQYLQELREQS